MSNSKKKSKKRRLSDSDSPPILPHSKRQKISHPAYRSRVISNCSMMEHDVELMNNSNSNNNVILKNSCNHNHNHNHHHHIAEESKELSPEPALLFMNDDDDETNIENIKMDKKILTPMGFNLSDDEIIGMVLEYLEAAGYGESVKCLSKESGIECVPRELDEKYLKQWVLNGEWQKLIDFYDSFEIRNDSYACDAQCLFESNRSIGYLSATDLFYSKIQIIEQKFFELIHQNAKLLATKVLNDELLPLISPLSSRENNKELQKNIENDIESDQNEADIELISSLIHRKKLERKRKKRRHIEYNIDNMNSLYPRWRWNKICSLLFCDNYNTNSHLFEELFCATNNVKDSRYKLYNELECKLVIKNKKTANKNNNLLSIFDEFVKCQLFQRQHFNLRSNEISLVDYKNYNENLNIGIPSETYYILDGHCSFITHLSFDSSGSWLISSSADKRTLIWDFSGILMQTNLNVIENRHKINIICDILHYLPVTSHALSPNRKYLITISEYQANLDDFKHDANATKHIQRQEDEDDDDEDDESDSNDDNIKSNLNVNKRQFKYSHFDESHRTYFDAKRAEKKEQKKDLIMETERGCNVYLWQLIESANGVEVELISQYHHYRREASVCWCPDSNYYFVTSYGCDIDLYCVESGEIICSLASNGNLMTDLRLTHSGYRLCVTLNGRDIRIYTTDFNEYYKLLKEYLVDKTTDDEAPPAFIPWLHFCDKNHVNLFENNISKYITKCLISKDADEEGDGDIIADNYSDLTQIASSSSSAAKTVRKKQIVIDNDDKETETDDDDDDDNKSLDSLDDKLWMFYEEKLDLDKKTHGQLRNDCIVSTAISCGDEYEYLLVLVHKFNICANRMLHPIILMIDLRARDNNNNNIKFFYGFKQNRFKLQCGFGGFSLPPIANNSLVYRHSKYHKNQQSKMKKKVSNVAAQTKEEESDNKNDNKMMMMMKEMVQICLKYPSFLPSQMQPHIDKESGDKSAKAIAILNLFKSLPFSVLSKLYKFMQNKLKLNNIQTIYGADAIDDINKAGDDEDDNKCYKMVDIRRQLLEFEVCSILNEQDQNEKYEKLNISKKCAKMKKEKKKRKKKKKVCNKNRSRNVLYDDENINYIWQRMDQLIDDHHLAMEMKYFIYQKKLKQKQQEEIIAIVDDNDDDIVYEDDDDANCSLNKLNLNEMKQISTLMNKEKNAPQKRKKRKKKKKNEKNSLIHSEYIENDYFGGHHFIISGSEDGNVCIWNRITQKIIKLAGHKKSVNCVAWNPKDSFILCSAGDDAQIRVWRPNKASL